MKKEYPVTHLEDVSPEPVKEGDGWKKDGYSIRDHR